MNQEEFFSQVLGDKGYYCLFLLQHVDGKAKREQLFFKEKWQIQKEIAKRKDGPYNIFFALGTFSEPTSRVADNVLQMKSFFLDLDCGEGKPFPTQKDAAIELQKFRQRNKLPRPTIISSGRGLHVYWILSEAISAPAWYDIASKLKKVCAEQGFGADPAVTSDSARVLRAPNTFNHKYDVSLPTQLIFHKNGILTIAAEDFAERIGVIDNDEVSLVLADGASKLLAGNDRLLSNKEAVFSTIAKKSLTDKGCAQIKHRIVNQATLAEPEWRGILSIATFCSDRATAIHKVSSKHPNYSPSETEEKATLIPKPHLCDSLRLDSEIPSLCDGCPHRGKIKTPISLGMQVKEAEIENGAYKIEPVTANIFDAQNLPTPAPVSTAIPVYPAPYIRGKSGGVYTREVSYDADGNREVEEVMVYRNDIYAVQRVYDVEDGEKLVVRLHLPNDGVREFGIPITHVTSSQHFREGLSKQGVAVINFTHLQKYFMKWLEQLQEDGGADEAHRQFGWVDKSFDTFILGDKRITANGIGYNAPHSQTISLLPALAPKGTLEGWKRAISIWEDERFVTQQYGLCMGFGSVLMELANVSSAAVHFYSKDSGVGKTAILEAMSSIWGDPSRLVLGKEDTPAFKMLRAEVYHNLPLPIDEITNLDGNTASDMLYQFSSGQQRGRLTSSANIERERGREWRLMVATTGNTSILQVIGAVKNSPRPEAQRILECHVKRLFSESDDKSLTDAFNQGIEDNHGHAGIEFVKYVIQNKEAVKEIAIEIIKKVDADAALTSENRFWSAQVAYTLAAAQIAKRAGLVNFKISTMYSWAINTLIAANKNGAIMEEQSLGDYLNDFFSDNLNSILIVDCGEPEKTTATLGGSQLQQVQRDARFKLMGRYEPDTCMFYIKISSFREWCASKQIDSAGVIFKVKARYGEGCIKQSRLGRGTPLAGLPAQRVICINFNADLGEEEDEGTSS